MIKSAARVFGDPVANEHYIVMTVECPTCKTKQKIHVAAAFGEQIGDQTVHCINCTNHFKVAVPDKILRGPFPV